MLNDSSTMSHFGSSPRIRFRARVFNVGTSYCGEALSDAWCIEYVTMGGYWPYPRVGIWTLEMVGGPCLQRGCRFLLFGLCDSAPIQMAQTLSRRCRGTSEKLGTCDGVGGALEEVSSSTHVTNAMSGISTTFPFSMHSSWPSQRILSSPER